VILTGLSVWNLVEVQVGIIAACAPTLRPILNHIIPTESIRSLLGSMRGQRSSQKAEDLPSFVKLGSSGKVDVSGRTSAQTLAPVDSQELVFLTETGKKV
jgi:hypothetical protein